MSVCKFVFNKKVPIEEIESKVALAIFTAEGLHGKAKVRLDAAYLASENEVIIDVATPVGERVAELFTVISSWEFGDRSFTVERIKDGGRNEEHGN